MIVITTILFLSVIIPFVSTKKVKELSIDIAWGLLFFVWAFQYEMSKDWSVYVSRWKIANYNLNLQTFDLEPIYEFILKICNPFSYYGYLILSALFGVFVLRIYINKYVPKNFVWMFFLTFSLGCGYYLEFVNTNRQTLAIMFVMIGVYILANFNNLKLKKYILGFILIIGVAFNIHRSAIIAVPMIFFPLINSNICNYKYLYVFLGINILSFLVDYSAISSYIEIFMLGNDELASFSHYTEEISERSKSVIEQGIFTFSLFLLIYNFEKFKSNEKPLILAAIVYLSLQGFAMYTMLRALSYYKIFFALSIPILYARISTINRTYKYISILIVMFYAAYMIYRYSIDIYTDNYVGYENFKTIFDVEKWM